MNEAEAIELGQAAGIAAARDLLRTQGVQILELLLRAGKQEWAVRAKTAGVHLSAGVPDELAGAYYQAYALAAVAHARLLSTQPFRSW